MKETENTSTSPVMPSSQQQEAGFDDFSLAELFLQRFFLCSIDGVLHGFNGRFYVPMNREKLESKILTVLQPELKKIGSSRKIKPIAYLLERMERPDYPEAFDWLGFADGILHIPSWTFYHVSPDTPPPTITYILSLPYDFSYHELIKDNIFPHTFRPIQEQHLDYGQYFYYLSPDEQNEYRECLYFNTNLDLIYSTPVANKFFSDIAGDDPVLIARIYEMIGYLLVPDTAAKSFFLLQGVPDSGKSILGRFMEGFFPQDRISALDISRLGGQFLPEALAHSLLNPKIPFKLYTYSDG